MGHGDTHRGRGVDVTGHAGRRGDCGGEGRVARREPGNGVEGSLREDERFAASCSRRECPCACGHVDGRRMCGERAIRCGGDRVGLCERAGEADEAGPGPTAGAGRGGGADGLRVNARKCGECPRHGSRCGRLRRCYPGGRRPVDRSWARVALGRSDAPVSVMRVRGEEAGGAAGACGGETLRGRGTDVWIGEFPLVCCRAMTLSTE